METISSIMKNIKVLTKELQDLVDYENKGLMTPQELARELQKLSGKKRYYVNPDPTNFNN